MCSILFTVAALPANSHRGAKPPRSPPDLTLLGRPKVRVPGEDSNFEQKALLARFEIGRSVPLPADPLGYPAGCWSHDG
jgi:hypothetical protein